MRSVGGVDVDLIQRRVFTVAALDIVKDDKWDGLNGCFYFAFKAWKVTGCTVKTRRYENK